MFPTALPIERIIPTLILEADAPLVPAGISETATEFDTVTDLFLRSPIVLAMVVSVDIFAVSFSQRLSRHQNESLPAVATAAIFGLSSALMLPIGWAIATFARVGPPEACQAMAAMILMGIGLRNIRGGLEFRGTASVRQHSEWITILVLAVASGIDSAVVGATMTMGEAELFAAMTVFAVIGFGMSLAGRAAGQTLGSSIAEGGQILGGFVLFLLGAIACWT